MSENRISGYGDRFNQNDFLIDTTEVTKSCQNLSEPSQELLYNSSGIDQGYRFSLIYCTSSGTCKNSVRFLQQQQIVFLIKKELSVCDSIKYQVKNRINLVDRELEVLQWPNLFSIEPTNDYSTRCFLDRLGSSLQWGSNIKAMDRGGENFLYKCIGTTSNKSSFMFLHQREKSGRHTLSHRRQGSLVLPFENGRRIEQTYDQIKQINLALCSKSQYAYQSRKPAFSTEYSSRQRIKGKTRLLTVASSS